LETETESRRRIESEKQRLYHELQRTAEYLRIATDRLQQMVTEKEQSLAMIEAKIREELNKNTKNN
jgi:chaperonin cofactor prefoldin